MRYKFLLLLLNLSFAVIQAQNIIQQTIPTLQQLPVNAIHRIFQDSEGYIWYGTVNGLCRDDGYHIYVFRSDIHTPGLLSNNLVNCIAEDKEGKIWFGTYKGGYVIDKRDYHITPLDSGRLGGKMIHLIYVTDDGSVWVSVTGELLRYRANMTLDKCFTLRNDNGRETFAGGLCQGRNGELIMARRDGVMCRLDTVTDEFIPFPTQGIKVDYFGNLIQDDTEDYYWVSNWGAGIVRFDPRAPQDSMYIYQPLPLNIEGQPNNIVIHMQQDNGPGYLWATASDNLIAFRKDSLGMLHQVDISYLLPASNQMLNEIIEDRQGNLWVSAFDQSSFIVRFTQDSSHGYALPAIHQRTKGKAAIMSLVDSGDHIFWISQERTGVCLYDLQNDKLVSYSDFTGTRHLPLNLVKEMTVSRQVPHGVWIAHEYGQSAILLGRSGMTPHFYRRVSVGNRENDAVRVLYEDDKKQLWIGTSLGLYRYDYPTDSLTAVCDTLGYVSGITQAANGALWVCTGDKGIYRISPDENQIDTFPFTHIFSSLTLTTDGTLWLGSEEGGLYAFYPHTGELKDFSSACDLNGDQVNGVIADIFNHIWISTNQKIIEFNPRNNLFYAYQTTDANMLLWRIIPTAATTGLDGKLYFGGIPGIFSITPSNRLESEGEAIRTHITNVSASNKSILLDGKHGNNSTASVILHPDDRNILIEFSSLNPVYAGKTRYAYQLEGIDTHWEYTHPGSNTAFYNQLPKGKYRFKVKATDANGLWSNVVTTLVIHRLPAFYETWWACFIYALLTLGILLYAIYAYVKRVERKNTELWSDSKEMVEMHRYLQTEITTPAYESFDKLLLEKVTKSIEENLSEPQFGVNELAQNMNMSRSTLTRKLKTITGQTPLDLIRHVKMQHAKLLLQDKQRNISEVSITLGYFNRKHFTQCFKDEFGITPSEYRKSLLPVEPTQPET
ncbi:MAG: helix-turn-helix domain-containing protein [Prevotellaceae bacterium]|jgi:ligand-binding sensor domain-containing protein/AraC-like DNA-binding protein|nr:helix-turn-helix domain-containing protein [Prevotellaceae bacterium]